MSIPITPHPAEDEDQERMIWRSRYSAKSLAGVCLGTAVLTAIIVLAVEKIQPLRESRAVWTTMAILVGTIWAGLICIGVYRKLARHYEITSQRLIHRNGILFRQVDRIEMVDIDDVTFRQGPLQSLMGVGTIQLQSVDNNHRKLVIMPGIPNVNDVARFIDEARRLERRKLGIHIESI